MDILSFDKEAFLEYVNRENHKLEIAPFVDSDYSNPERWDADLHPLYIRELDIVDYDGRDSSFQYYLISNSNFKSRCEYYISLTKDMNLDEINDLIDSSEKDGILNRRKIHEKLYGMKESYRVSFHIIAFEYRCILEAVKLKKFSQKLQSGIINSCHRCLASSYNPNYHNS
ncbi:hypothetical protein [Acinetobacter oleivorans]|uniref:hypothetical protein n=1 Tax=Acinetobacter oleivorans TaxID=1148157 RepID=UPI002B262B0C|nr:hypothetical protein [Acinetobacter oleivorans]WQF74666.1 hypothetical protein OKW95_09190 [Acinetobacter oleivorans]WQF74671.1 hypothetical protein OKW95_09215 [Acinetobacter oleivorans]